jgi:hypothetical protein
MPVGIVGTLLKEQRSIYFSDTEGTRSIPFQTGCDRTGNLVTIHMILVTRSTVGLHLRCHFVESHIPWLFPGMKGRITSNFTPQLTSRADTFSCLLALVV